MIKNYTALTFLAVCTTFTMMMAGETHTAYAQDDAAPTEASSSAQETTQKLKERIERIVEEKREQIKGVLDTLDQEKRGFIGEVTRVSEETITVTNIKGTQIIPYDDSISLLKDDDAIELAEVEVGNWLVVMGLIEDDTFAAKRILVSEDTLRPDTVLVEIGAVQNIARNSITIVSRASGNTGTFDTTTSTRYQDITGQEIDRNAITEDVQAIVIGSENEDNERTARLVRVLTTVEADE